METFSALLALCAENAPDTDEFTSQRPVTRSFDIFVDMRLNKGLSKQSRGNYDITAMIQPLSDIEHKQPVAPFTIMV